MTDTRAIAAIVACGLIIITALICIVYLDEQIRKARPVEVNYTYHPQGVFIQ